jgi:ABC-2 type transport system permease protein
VNAADEISLGRACRSLASLKWNLLRNGLRGRMQLRVQTWSSIVASTVLGLFGLAAFAGIGRSFSNGDLVVVITLPIIVAGIALLSAAAGVETTIDLRNLATEPVGPQRLGAAALTAALVGPPALLAGLSGVGLYLGFGSGAGAAGRMVVVGTVVAWWATLLLASRTAANVLGVLAHGRSKHVAQTLAAFAAVGMWFGAQLALQAIQTWDRPRWERLADVFAWTPPGQLGRALATASSAPGTAALHLLAGLTWLPLLWWVHGVMTGRLVTAPVRPGTDSRRVRTGRVGVRAGALRVLPPGRATAVGARTIRTKMRTPREAVNTIVALLLGMGALVVGPLLGGGSTDARIVLTAGLLHFAVLFESSNAFGFDGPPLWMEIAAGADGRVLTRGKAVSSIVTMAPFAVLLVLALSAIHGGWSFAPAGLLLALGSVLLATGASVVSTTLAPFAVPESPNPFAAGDTGQGCVASLVLLADMVVLSVVSAPVGLAVWWASTQSAVLTTAVSLLGPVVGAAVLFGCLRLAGGMIEGREAELVARVTPAR